MNRLSYSAISTYRGCPLRYKFIYIDKLKTLPKPYFSFGSSLHKATEFFYSGMFATPPTLDELLNYYEENWESEGFKSKDDEQKHFELGKKILEEFHKINSKDYKIPIAVEYKFNVDLKGIVLTGIIDRVDKLPSGSIEIIDYKSGKRLPSIEELNNDLQLSIYYIAAEKIWGILPEKLTIYHLRSNKTFSTHRKPDKIKETIEIMFDVLNDIEKRKFEAKESPLCSFCDFHQFCPEFAHKYEIEESPQMILGEVNIPESIKDYVQTKEKIKELKFKANEIGDAIIRYCEDKGFSRVYGEKYSVTISKVEKKGYEEDEVKKLLEDEDLWQNVLSFNPKRLIDLLEDPNLSYELKKKLKDLEKVISTYNQLRYKEVEKEK
ncbi:MAG: PD-(D/E)XK nuclease family protein [Candidatus Humimicrobiia bacterium]